MSVTRDSGTVPTTDDAPLLIERRGGLVHVTLNTPQRLNALTETMAYTIHDGLVDWRADDTVSAVLVDGAGERAFCAGGDIVTTANIVRTCGACEGVRYFHSEYAMNWRIRHFAKPYVAVMHGIVMGGGVGLAAHGSARVVTESTQFAMPETGIGFFPDVGMTHILPRLPDALGAYLGLTGARINAADCLDLGLATHFVPAAHLDRFKVDLAANVDTALQRHTGHPPMAPSLDAPKRAVIAACFAHERVEDIIDSLAAEGSDFALATLATLRTRSPLALQVARRALLNGAGIEDFSAIMQAEFRVAYGLLAAPDFYEGVRALLLDKDKQPRWQPARLEEVTEAMVRRCFEPVPDDKLNLTWENRR